MLKLVVLLLVILGLAKAHLKPTTTKPCFINVGMGSVDLVDIHKANPLVSMAATTSTSIHPYSIVVGIIRELGFVAGP